MRTNQYKKTRWLTGMLLIICMVVLGACGTKTPTDSDQKVFQEAAATKTTEKKTEEESRKTAVQALQAVNEIPDDGIISKEQFETVAGQDMEVQFTGESEEGISYTWTYNAAQIQNPQDQNLMITFEEDDLDEIKEAANNANDALMMTMYGKGMICPATLKVEIPEAWQSDTGMLLKEQNDKLARMSDVTISSHPDKEEAGSDEKKTTEASSKTLSSLTEAQPGTTSLEMTVTSLDGDCYIVGGITKDDKIAAINDLNKASANANAAAGTAGAAAGDSVAAGSGSATGSGSSVSNSSGGSTSSDVAADVSGGSGSSGSGSGSGSGSSGSGSKTLKCTISINCATILDNMENLTDGKEEFVPSNGWILKATTVTFTSGDSVHDVLQKVCKDNGIHMESRFTPAYDSAYVEGINQLYEFDCGELSGWMYNVNGWFPNYGCSKYTVSDGDEINWVYTCDLGKDVGDNSMY